VVKKYSILATEGPHDQAFLAKLLGLLGFKQFRGGIGALDPFWRGFVPTYPPPSGRLYERMNMPSILTSQTDSVVVYWGEGNNLISNLILLAMNNERYIRDIHAFGLVVDADKKEPHLVAQEKAQKLREIFPTISTSPGTITEGTPRTGIYILPNNKEQGTLDTCLQKCASVVYPDHKAGAEAFLNNLASKHTQHLTAFTREKALVACIVGILKPGKSNTASIADDKWVSEETLKEVDDILSLFEFIKRLLEVPLQES
jgi:hypothetical protein